MVAVGRGVRASIAAGENLTGLEQFRPLLAAGAVDVVQTAAGWGITHFLRVAALAHAYDLPVSPIGTTPLGLVHAATAVPNHMATELQDLTPPEGLSMDMSVEDGRFILGDNPGLGMDVDEEAIALVEPPEVSPSGRPAHQAAARGKAPGLPAAAMIVNGLARGLGLTGLGFGGAPMGNLYSAVTDEVAGEAVAAAWDAGLRYFDTAPHYGLGLSERRLGRSLRGYPREEFVVSTKVGRRLEPSDTGGQPDPEGFAVPATHRRLWDFSRDGVLRSIEASLERLGLDRIDLVLIHDPDDHAREALEEAAPALSQLRSEGVIGGYGAGMNQAPMLARFVRETDVDVVMVAGRFTLLDQTAGEDLLPVALERGVGVINAGIYNSGLLSSPRPRARRSVRLPQSPPVTCSSVRPGSLVSARSSGSTCRPWRPPSPAVTRQS